MDVTRTTTEEVLVQLLMTLGADPDDPNFQGTPRRVAAWLRDHFITDEAFERNVEVLAKAVFPSDYDGMITQDHIIAYGLCPHHLMSVRYHVAVGYLPQRKVIGLSKLARVVNLCLARADLQEDLTVLLAKTLQQMLGTTDVAVVVKGKHSCMSVRGVKAHKSHTTTSEMRGHFQQDEGGCKSEFLRLIR